MACVKVAQMRSLCQLTNPSPASTSSSRRSANAARQQESDDATYMYSWIVAGSNHFARWRLPAPWSAAVRRANTDSRCHMPNMAPTSKTYSSAGTTYVNIYSLQSYYMLLIILLCPRETQLPPILSIRFISVTIYKFKKSLFLSRLMMFVQNPRLGIRPLIIYPNYYCYYYHWIAHRTISIIYGSEQSYSIMAHCQNIIIEVRKLLTTYPKQTRKSSACLDHWGTRCISMAMATDREKGVEQSEHKLKPNNSSLAFGCNNDRGWLNNHCNMFNSRISYAWDTCTCASVLAWQWSAPPKLSISTSHVDGEISFALRLITAILGKVR